MRNLITAAAVLASATAVTAQDYPSQTVTVVVPFSPAGSVDPFARFLFGELQEKWGVSVVIDNRPGAGATIGTAHVASEPADGYTLLVSSSAFTTSAAVYDDLPYDPREDLVPVAMGASSPFVVTAGASVESETLPEFLENEAAERQIFLATAGLGSSTHFAGELLVAATDIDAEPVHYAGGTEAMVDLIGGRADIYVGSITAVLSNVQAGQLKALAVIGSDRARALPDVPSTEEVGVTGVDTSFWLAVFAPAGTPDEIVEKINADVNAVMASEAGAEYLERIDAVAMPMSAAEFQELVEREIEQWTELAEARGIAAE